MPFGYRRTGQQNGALRQTAAGFVHGCRRHIRTCRHRGDRQVVPKIKVRAVRLIREAQHPVLMCNPDDGAQVGADAVVGRIVDQNRFGIRMQRNRPLHVRNAHTERNAQPLITGGINVNRNRTAQHHGSHDTAVHIARQDNFLAPLDRGQHHGLHCRGSSAHHEKGVRRAECLRRQLFRIPDDGHRMAQIVQRLHGIDIHAHAFFSQKSGQLGIAAPALVSGHIERNNPLFFKSFQRLINRRLLLRK